jgi:AraC-like DNA-binding protein
MNTRLHNNPNWLELAKQSGFKASVLAVKLTISRWTLHRHMKTLLGQSPQAWLNGQRLICAGKMLKDCDSIKWLASELGYKNVSHFCHQFKRRYGLSPTEFLTGNKWQAVGEQRPSHLSWPTQKSEFDSVGRKNFKSATSRQ